MERRNFIVTPWVSPLFFPAGSEPAKEIPENPALLFPGEFQGTFEGAGSKDFSPLKFLDFPEEKKVLKRPPSGGSGEEKIDGKGSQR
jgi:hypothetical protein